MQPKKSLILSTFCQIGEEAVRRRLTVRRWRRGGPALQRRARLHGPGAERDGKRRRTRRRRGPLGEKKVIASITSSFFPLPFL